MTAIDLSTNRAHEAAFLVYVNGVEIPVTRVSYSHDIGEFPRADIALFPDPELARLGAEDRVEVQVFFKDDFYSAIEGKDPDFRLLFDGEIKKWSYSNTARGRSLNVSCLDKTSILNDLQLYFVTGLDSAVQSTFLQNATGATTTTPDHTLPWSLFFYGLAQQGKDASAQRPFDLIANFFRACNSDKEAPDLGSIVTSTFFNRYFAKNGTQFHFVPSPVLEFDLVEQNEFQLFPLLKAVRQDQVISSLTRRMQEEGLGATAWEALRLMFQSMYYEIAAIPAPPAVAVRETSAGLDHGRIVGPPSSQTPQDRIYLAHHVTKPQWLFGIAPACNVLFPSMIQSLQFEEDIANQPTRCIISKTEIIHPTEGANQVVNEILKVKAGYPPQVDRELTRSDTNPAISGRNFLVWPEEYFKGPITAMEQMPRWFEYLRDLVWNTQTVEQQIARKALDAIEQASASSWVTAYAQASAEAAVSVPDTSVDQASQARVLQERQRQTLADVEKKLFDNISKENSLIAELRKTGVITGAVTSLADLKRILSDRTKENTIETDRLIKTYARYEYQRLRSSARNGMVRTAFNPYIIPGFPVVIFNTEEDGNHFIGYVTSVNHAFSAEGGAPEMSTTIQFTHGQTLDELIEEIFEARTGDNAENIVYDIASAPPNAIATLRNVLQVQDKAEEYFSILLHQNQEYQNNKVKSAAFDISKAIRFSVAGIQRPTIYPFNAIFEEDRTKQEIDKRRQEEAKDEEAKQKELDSIRDDLREGYLGRFLTSEVTEEEIGHLVDAEMILYQEIKDQEYAMRRLQRNLEKPRRGISNFILDNYSRIVPTPEFESLFDSFDQAMSYAARPVCTLEEYINFRAGWGKRGRTIPVNDPVEGKGALYYDKILDLKQGPGATPALDTNNVPLDPKPKDLPDTRIDWATRLQNYRKRILFGKICTGSED